MVEGKNRNLEVGPNYQFLTISLLTYLSQVTFLRKQHGSRLNVFAPVNDLSTLSKTGSVTRSLLPGRKNDVAISDGQILGDEYSDHVVKVCELVQHGGLDS